MLTSIRVKDNRKIYAASAEKEDAPFKCPKCGEETILKKGLIKTDHFAHKPPVTCQYGLGESEAHRKCKQDIFDHLVKHEDVLECEMEKDFDTVVSDIYYRTKNLRIAIEVQVSSLTMEKIIYRTQKYERLGIYVLWLPLFNKNLNKSRYSPKQWEKWIHATYYGRVYYWLNGLSILPVHFEDYLLYVELTEYGGGYDRKSKRYRKPYIGNPLNLLDDFKPRERNYWTSNTIVVPKCKILMDSYDAWWK